ncbi:hypothetical protein NOC27_115 [Nitrosococcus oceani AFC27]|nr:hypothetical protein NOC27_115 [Nitrosococcus oceani AFC27]GEM21012.1 hypothetical protein NONS58_24400 [Nitrosococcus oceani]
MDRPEKVRLVTKDNMGVSNDSSLYHVKYTTEFYYARKRSYFGFNLRHISTEILY